MQGQGWTEQRNGATPAAGPATGPRTPMIIRVSETHHLLIMFLLFTGTLLRAKDVPHPPGPCQLLFLP